MNETIITWNVPNWITITLMAFLGFAVFGIGINAAKRLKGSGTNANS
jgi:hypothetical protein